MYLKAKKPFEVFQQILYCFGSLYLEKWWFSALEFWREKLISVFFVQVKQANKKIHLNQFFKWRKSHGFIFIMWKNYNVPICIWIEFIFSWKWFWEKRFQKLCMSEFIEQWCDLVMLFSLIVVTPVHILTTKSTKPICFISLLLEYSWFWTGRK